MAVESFDHGLPDGSPADGARAGDRGRQPPYPRPLARRVPARRHGHHGDRRLRRRAGGHDRARRRLARLPAARRPARAPHPRPLAGGRAGGPRQADRGAGRDASPALGHHPRARPRARRGGRRPELSGPRRRRVHGLLGRPHLDGPGGARDGDPRGRGLARPGRARADRGRERRRRPRQHHRDPVPARGGRGRRGAGRGGAGDVGGRRAAGRRPYGHDGGRQAAGQADRGAAADRAGADRREAPPPRSRRRDRLSGRAADRRRRALDRLARRLLRRGRRPGRGHRVPGPPVRAAVRPRAVRPLLHLGRHARPGRRGPACDVHRPQAAVEGRRRGPRAAGSSGARSSERSQPRAARPRPRLTPPDGGLRGDLHPGVGGALRHLADVRRLVPRPLLRRPPVPPLHAAATPTPTCSRWSPCSPASASS